jgi:hypothetical protein
VMLTGRFDTEHARGSASYAGTGGVKFIW